MNTHEQFCRWLDGYLDALATAYEHAETDSHIGVIRQELDFVLYGARA